MSFESTEPLTKEEIEEGMYLVIIKGLCDFKNKEWQKVTLKSGREIAFRLESQGV